MVINDAARRTIVEALQTEMEEGQVRGLLKALEALPEAEAESTPEATTSTFGTVKRATDPNDLGPAATLEDVINKLNELMLAMRQATLIQEAF